MIKKHLKNLRKIGVTSGRFLKHCKWHKQDFKPQTLFLKNDHNYLLSEPRDIL